MTKDENLRCPKCDHVQTCPCGPCQKRRPTEKPWVNKGNFIACGNCGHTMPADSWGDLEYDLVTRLQREGKLPPRQPPIGAKPGEKETTP